MSKKTYRLPPGEPRTTRDQERYLKEWHALAEPLLRAFNWQLLAFYPGFQFDIDGRRTVSLETDVVRAIGEVIKERDVLRHAHKKLMNSFKI